jgi:hypothetical protein
LILSFALLAASATAAMAAPCTTGPLSGYIGAAFSCSVSDKTFSDFFYSAPSTGMPQPANITVTPQSSATNPGLLFSGTWSNTTGSSIDAVLLFTVTETGSGSITGATLQVSGQGIFDDTETQVPPGQLNLTATDNALHSQTFDPVQTSLRVSDDLLIGNGAVVSSMDKRFLQEPGPPTPPTSVPEPGTLSALGAALLLAGWIGRSRASRVTRVTTSKPVLRRLAQQS